MLKAAGLGMALVQRESGAGATLAAADLVPNSVLHALELLQRPMRLRATLRS